MISPPWVDDCGDSGSDFSEYKYDNIHLPPAGLSSGRLKHHCGKNTRNRNADFTLIQMKAENARQVPADFVGMRSLVDPAGYNLPAGTKSERVSHRREYGMHDWEFGEDGVAGVTKGGDRGDEMRRFKPHQSQLRAKAEFSKHNDGPTDPITHFGDIYNRFDCQGNDIYRQVYRPGRKYGYANEASSQKWTWRQGVHDPYANTVPCSRKKFHTSVRGERAYNVCGNEDMLPGATADFVKCDVPPPRAYVMANDKRYLPLCARTADTDAYRNAMQAWPEGTSSKYDSSRIWSCMIDETMSQPRLRGSIRSDGNVRATSSRGSLRSMASSRSESSMISRASKSSGRATRPRPMSAGLTAQDLKRRNALQQSGVAERVKDLKTKGRTKSSPQLQYSDPGRRRSASASSMRRSRSSGSGGSRRSQPKLMMRGSR